MDAEGGGGFLVGKKTSSKRAAFSFQISEKGVCERSTGNLIQRIQAASFPFGASNLFHFRLQWHHQIPSSPLLIRSFIDSYFGSRCAALFLLFPCQQL